MNRSFNPLMTFGFDMNANKSIITPGGIYIPIIPIITDMKTKLITAANVADFNFNVDTITLTESAYYIISDPSVLNVVVNPTIEEMIFIVSMVGDTTIIDNMETPFGIMPLGTTWILTKIVGDGVLIPAIELVMPIATMNPFVPAE